MKWPSFTQGSYIYDLSHLHPQTFRFERPADGNKVAERYTVDVVFSAHCFTRDPRPGESYDRNLIYQGSGELRIFDSRRYNLSKLLPAIIRDLPNKKIRQNGAHKFFTIDVILEDGKSVEYDIFFKVKKAERRGCLEMILESAFVRDPSYDSTRPAGRPIRFWIILHNTLNNKNIHF